MMTKFKNYDPSGVIPACILPFHDDLSLDLKSFKKHLLDVSAVEGLSAITINAHSTEVGSCTPGEQQQIMMAAGEAIGDRLPIVHGIYAEGSLEAARIARQAAAAGATALLVFPPGPGMLFCVSVAC
jgi:4-hydroxy-tetrahydrodipicolinate synthase